MSKLSAKTKALCEAAVMVALAVILGMLRLYRLPDGGSITIAILPLVFFAVRYGPGWGFLAGFAYGGLDYIVGQGIAIDWTSATTLSPTACWAWGRGCSRAAGGAPAGGPPRGAR